MNDSTRFEIRIAGFGGQGVATIGKVPAYAKSCARISPLPLKKRIKVLSSGRRENGSGFSYLDTASDAGVVLLVRQSPPGGSS